jgi:hypothetical protein
LGAVIKPNRIYISNRTKGNFYAAIQKHNAVARAAKPTAEQKSAFLCTMNSYLGILNPNLKKRGQGLYKTYKLRKRMVRKHVSGWWENIFYAKNYQKFTPRKRVAKSKAILTG